MYCMPQEYGKHTYNDRYNPLIAEYLEEGEDKIRLVVKQVRLWPGVPFIP